MGHAQSAGRLTKPSEWGGLSDPNVNVGVDDEDDDPRAD
jgi:hypothetical protein